MHTPQRSLIGLLAITASATVQADSFDLNANNQLASLGYSVEAIRSLQGVGFDLGILYDNDNNRFAHIGVNVRGENWSRSGNFKVSMETRLYLADTYIPQNSATPFATVNKDTTNHLAVGGQVIFVPMPRLGLGAEIFYAPRIFSFGGGENFTLAGLRISYRLIPQADLYLGYRYATITLDGLNNSELEIDNRGHAGFQYFF